MGIWEVGESLPSNEQLLQEQNALGGNRNAWKTTASKGLGFRAQAILSRGQ